MTNPFVSALALSVLAGTSLGAYSGPYTETEPNNNVGQVTNDPNFATQLYELPTSNTLAVLNGITTGSNTVGTASGGPSAGQDTADYWRVTTGTMAAGIYRNTLTRPNTSSYGVNLFGQASSVGPGTPSGTGVQIGQSMGNSNRNRSWFTFGAPAVSYYRITGSASTSTSYGVDYSVTAITPNAAGSVDVSGATTLTVTTSHPTIIDSELWVYDSSFNLIAHNDNRVTGSDLASLVLTLGGSSNSPAIPNGTYYFAITTGFSNGDSASYYNPTAAGFNQERFAGTDVYGFYAGSLYGGNSSSNATGFTLGLQVDGGSVVTTTAATGLSTQDASWFVVNVVPAPGAGALVGLGALTAARRRRA